MIFSDSTSHENKVFCREEEEALVRLDIYDFFRDRWPHDPPLETNFQERLMASVAPENRAHFQRRLIASTIPKKKEHCWKIISIVVQAPVTQLTTSHLISKKNTYNKSLVHAWLGMKWWAMKFCPWWYITLDQRRKHLPQRTREASVKSREFRTPVANSIATTDMTTTQVGF